MPEIELAMVWRRDNPSAVLQTFLEVARQFGRRDINPISDR
ncbi:hypothetical protein [Pleurocapsa sp. PCC 7327]|nr:hypothetical protein [Pleurocapsa sp. PCC 7327]